MMSKPGYRFALFATVLAVVVVLLGAYTRLTHSGLGCPDWPGCYGQLFATDLPASAQPQKAWTEMTHRYAAGTLGLMVLTLFFLFLKTRLFWPTILLVVVIFQALLGMWTVTLQLHPLVVMSH